jgi:hypothetical protein
MKKLEKNGQVGVVYSPGFGAGWFTWNQEYPELVFDPAIVKMVDEQDFEQLKTYIHLKYPDIYIGGIDTLEVAWLKIGTAFRIHEYDGSESLEVKEDLDWMIA